MMGTKPAINLVFCGILVLFACTSCSVNAFQVCPSTSLFDSTSKICDDNAYCCGTYNNDCCYNPFGNSDSSYSRGNEQAMELFALFVVLVFFTSCCICCYRCCCSRTTSRGYVYSTPGTTTAVSVSLPPNQAQQVPYPTVVPYPQQTPYPPQYNPPTNPYYGMPPPAYGVAVQSAGNQQASAPSAPYMG